MIDCHIHLERGTYTLDWIYEFINNAIKNNIEEIWLLEHCYRFREFLSMYDSVCVNSKYIDTWFHRKAGVINLSDFLNFTDIVRQEKFPIKIKFGLEICYFQKFENFIYNLTKDSGLDFLVGSVHYVDDFAFDHKAEHWMGIDVDKTYHRYFQMSIDLAKSGIFNGIAHPDCIKLFGHKPSFLLNDYYDKLAKALAQGTCMQSRTVAHTGGVQ